MRQSARARGGTTVIQAAMLDTYKITSVRAATRHVDLDGDAAVVDEGTSVGHG